MVQIKTQRPIVILVTPGTNHQVDRGVSQILNGNLGLRLFQDTGLRFKYPPVVLTASSILSE